MAADVEAIVNDVMAPDRWAAAVEALAAALGVEAAALEPLLREHLAAFLSGAPGGFDAADVARKVRGNRTGFAH